MLAFSIYAQLFVKQLVQANNTSNIKALHYWPFVRGIHHATNATDHLWGESPPKGRVWKWFALHDILSETARERDRNQQGINDVNFQQMPAQCHWLLILKANQPRTHAGQIANYKLILDMQAFYKTSS